MRTFLMGLVIAAAGCTEQAMVLPIGQLVVQDCGAQPLAPGWSIAHENGHTIMSDVDFSHIESWRAAIESWQSCVADHP